jgi:drug/metabolite transporter (DMT)-like permease
MVDEAIFITLIVFVSLCWAVASQIDIYAVQNCAPVSVASLRYLATAIICVLFAVFSGQFAQLHSRALCKKSSVKEYRHVLLIIAALGVLSAAGGIAYLYTLKRFRNPTSVVALVFPLSLVFTLILGVLFDKEAFTTWHVIGFLAALLAVIFLSVGNHVNAGN